ncbi:MAG: hypothetical protein NUV61_02525 [Candidatus Azambacteria bacterium]|nr:hypothetical protein [Candidatus Azambacteria bacterium]
MKNICEKGALILLVGIIIGVPFGGFAQINPIGMIDAGGTNVGVNSAAGVALGADNLVTTITTLVNWFAWFIALASVVMGLYAGFLFITAQGEAAQLKTARATVLWAVVGITVAIISFSIILITRTILII